jgi:hypothetical protein
MPRSSLAREPEPERDFLERLDPDFVERLDPEPPLLLFLLSAIRDHPVHHLLYGETTLVPIRSDCKRGFAFLRRLAQFDRCVATCFRSLGRTRTLDSHASRLRRKLDPDAGSIHLSVRRRALLVRPGCDARGWRPTHPACTLLTQGLTRSAHPN